MSFFHKLSYSQKNRLLLVAGIIFLFIVYILGIKRTLVKYEECSELEKKTNLAISARAELSLLEKKFSAMEERTENYAGKNVQQSLLGIVSKYCNENGVIVKDFSQPVISVSKDVTIETNWFVVEGSFTKALRLVYDLEQLNKLGRVASVDFALRKNYSTKSNSLTTTIYIQNIKKENNEN